MGPESPPDLRFPVALVYPVVFRPNRGRTHSPCRGAVDGGRRRPHHGRTRPYPAQDPPVADPPPADPRRPRPVAPDRDRLSAPLPAPLTSLVGREREVQAV